MNKVHKANPPVLGGSSQCNAIGSTQVHPGIRGDNLWVGANCQTTPARKKDTENLNILTINAQTLGNEDYYN